ncbi:MAG: STAS domain-containing protein [Streptosporangiaceae bacterium]
MTCVYKQSDQLSWVDGRPVVRAAEEIDLTNADALRAAILAAHAAAPDTVIVDMTDTAFCDSTGLNVLVRAHKQLEDQGGQLRVVIREPTLLRILTVTGISRMFHMFASLDEAIAGPPEAPRSPAQARGLDG